MRRDHFVLGKTFLGLVLLVVGCGRSGKTSGAAEPPAKSIPRPSETALTTVTLTADAEKRLGLEFGMVEKNAAATMISVPGEVIVPAGGALVLTAPFSATVSGSTLPKPGAIVKKGQTLLNLAPFAPPDRDVRAQAEKSVAIASAQLATVKTKVERLEKLLAEGGASEKQLQEAQAERDVLQAELGAAQKRLTTIRKAPLGADVSIALHSPRDGVVRSISVAPGQVVAAGAPLFEILGSPALWVRVSVYAGEAEFVVMESSAQISSVGRAASHANAVVALPVLAPPSADPLRSTVDFYYELPTDTKRRPGERIVAFLRTKQTAEQLVVPFSALVFDAGGGSWLYVETKEHAYERRRVDVVRIENGRAILALGPAVDTRIVRTGASELFGVEFGVGK
ncbi:MAG: HlyD family efflux transporter periplasmic adaptor subunit [Polyangiaceae bacterium]|nr:HlyD family efflux transporter periplasmic adaptor subunit [Polyangiaceae bacterium]